MKKVQQGLVMLRLSHQSWWKIVRLQSYWGRAKNGIGFRLPPPSVRYPPGLGVPRRHPLDIRLHPSPLSPDPANNWVDALGFRLISANLHCLSVNFPILFQKSRYNMVQEIFVKFPRLRFAVYFGNFPTLVGWFVTRWWFFSDIVAESLIVNSLPLSWKVKQCNDQMWQSDLSSVNTLNHKPWCASFMGFKGKKCLPFMGFKGKKRLPFVCDHLNFGWVVCEWCLIESESNRTRLQFWHYMWNIHSDNDAR